VARDKEGRTPSHAQVLYSVTQTLIAFVLQLTHAQPSWISETILESPQLEGSVERVSLNHAAILAELGDPGQEGRDTFACPSPFLRNPTFDCSRIATAARTTELALFNHA